MMLTNRGAALRCLYVCLLAGVTVAAASCGDATAPEGSTFTADVRGDINERITGSALASGSEDWNRQMVVQVTAPNGATFSGVALSATGQKTTISIMRPGSEIPTGTFKIGRVGGALPFPAGGFSGGYVVRRSDGLQLFMADSGAVTFSQSGSRVTGTFTLYANRYDVIPFPTAGTSGQIVTPISSGNSQVTISGQFDAVRR